MTIPKEAIAKAIEGGYGPKWDLVEVYGRSIVIQFKSDIAEQPHVTWAIERVVLDPSFWQSLGKALGWQGKHDPQTDMLVLQAMVHQFVDLILTGADTQAFWDELLTPIEE